MRFMVSLTFLFPLFFLRARGNTVRDHVPDAIISEITRKYIRSDADIYEIYFFTMTMRTIISGITRKYIRSDEQDKLFSAPKIT